MRLTQAAVAYAAAKDFLDRQTAKLTEFDRLARIHKYVTVFGIQIDLLDPAVQEAIKAQHVAKQSEYVQKVADAFDDLETAARELRDE